MSEFLIQSADTVLTVDDARRELQGADILVRDGVIAAIGPGLTTTGAIHSAAGCVVTPGLVNTHHHLYQTLTRAVPGGQDALLFGWLQRLYPIWARFGPEEMWVSAMVGLAELALSGCTTSSDHLYLYPNGVRLDAESEQGDVDGVGNHRDPLRRNATAGDIVAQAFTDGRHLIGTAQCQALQEARSTIAQTALCRRAMIDGRVFPGGTHFIDHRQAPAAPDPETRQGVEYR